MNELSQAQRLRGKNVVVIGGSRGLGRAIVAAAHAEGAHVLAVARQEAELAKLETFLRDSIQSGIDEEMAAARDRGMAGSTSMLDLKINVLGVRPAGELPENSPLLAALLAADTRLGNRSRRERSSTDANIPLSVGIPAISLGAGGRSGGAHTTEEWFDPTNRELGLQRVALTLLAVAGLEP